MECTIICVLGSLIFLAGIQSPGVPYFDETHYLPAAREILDGLANSNPEHPPFAKALIALDMGVLGDNPLGWRAMSALFGGLSLMGIYLWSLALFADRAMARWVAAVSAVNQILYVQARIAMLDIFATAFILLALAGFAASWRGHHARRFLLASGACLGLAAACKWTGLIAWMGFVATILTIKLLQAWRTAFADARQDDWYRPDLWQAVRTRDWLICFLLVPFALYYFSFGALGLDHLAPATFLQAQARMWQDNSTLIGFHPYMSHWFDWPLIRRPIWYYFSATSWGTATAHAAAVVCLGNPLVYWLGIPALLVCAHGWIVRRDRAAFLILMAYGVLYLCWAVMPARLEFAFYYLPGAMVLGPALAFMFAGWRARWPRYVFLGAAAAVFVWLLPISQAGLGVSGDGYVQRMLFASWR